MPDVFLSAPLLSLCPASFPVFPRSLSSADRRCDGAASDRLSRHQWMVSGDGIWYSRQHLWHAVDFYRLQFPSFLKGVIRCKILFYMLFGHKCVQCTQPTYKDKNPPCFFYIDKSWLLSKIKPFSESCQCDITQTGPSHDCWLTLAFNLSPALSELSSVLHYFDAGADVDKNGSYKRLRCFVDGCNNEHSSRHLPRHLSRWRHSGLPFLNLWRECVNHWWSSFAYSEYMVL